MVPRLQVTGDKYQIISKNVKNKANIVLCLPPLCEKKANTLMFALLRSLQKQSEACARWTPSVQIQTKLSHMCPSYTGFALKQFILN